MKQASETSNTRISRLQGALPGVLDDLAVLAFDGPDAVPFAQAQLAADVATLSVAHWMWAALLSPQGRVLGFGPLLRPSDQRLLWIVPVSRRDALLAALQRFVLRRKVALSAAPFTLEGHAGGPPTPAPHASGALADRPDGWRLALGGVGGRWLDIASVPAGDAAPIDRSAAEAWRAFDVLDALPRIEDAAVDAFTAHALALQRVAAFSTGKGCYPGQEIVARTHFLGRNKRGPRVGWLPAGGALPAPGSRWLADGAAPGGETMAETVQAAMTPAGVAVLLVAREDAPALLRQGEAVARFDPLPGAGADAAKML